jgi:hydroxypyruvate reductase
MDRVRALHRLAGASSHPALPAEAGPKEEALEDVTVMLLREMFDAALLSVSPELCLPPHLPGPVPGKTLILGVGKAAASMTKVATARMEGRWEAIVLTRYGHGLPQSDIVPGTQTFEAGHPLPDQRGLEATQIVFNEVRKLGPDDQLLMLVSGGGSALLTMPAPGVSLADKQMVTRALLNCGASISEINCVRTHLSGIKGGRLAEAAYPARVITCAISDIPGDDPALVASGPTIADKTKLSDARRILDHYRIARSAEIDAALDDPANETPFASSKTLIHTRSRVVARAQMAMEAAGQIARAAGYRPVYLGDDIEGDAAEMGTIHAALALHHAGKGGKFALLSGGETTVVVRNPMGRGGRNTEYLLSLALSLNGARGIYALSCDTDGIDGTEDNAGAIVTPSTLGRAGARDVSAMDALNSNRAYDFFETIGDLVVTGPTRTNVNDFRIILVDR